MGQKDEITWQGGAKPRHFHAGGSVKVSRESLIAAVCPQDRPAYVSVMWAAGV